MRSRDSVVLPLVIDLSDKRRVGVDAFLAVQLYGIISP